MSTALGLTISATFAEEQNMHEHVWRAHGTPPSGIFYQEKLLEKTYTKGSFKIYKYWLRTMLQYLEGNIFLTTVYNF